ncbi:MAG: hypothetical protein IRY99_03565 [Isosphaeraceae bacterium]|nr:hypothetical protein [Isosphaeraceae bacterium]
MRRALLPGLIALALAFVGLNALADGDPPKGDRSGTPPAAKGAKASKVPAFTPEREAAALTFIRRHHPELATLLEQLRPMNQEEYEQAIGELFQVSESLAALKTRDPRRYELALEAWKAKSRVELLAAQLANTPSPALESRLRAALEAQIQIELRQQRYDREQLEARLKKLNESIERLERDRGRLVESRLNNIVKKSQRARRIEAGASADVRPSRTKEGKTR